MNLADLVAAHALERPDHLALVQGDRTVTYAELDDLSARVGAWLLHNGVAAGDRVLYYSNNTLELLVTYLGAARIGAVFAPVNAGFRVQEFGYVATRTKAAVAFVSSELVEDYSSFESALPDLPDTVVVVGDTHWAGRVSFRDVLATHEVAPIADVDPETMVLISFTSGSTANPKPVARSHGAETWSARTYADVWDYLPHDRALVALPLSWAYGMSTTTTALLAAGSTIVLLTHFNPVRVLETVERERITLFAGTSTMFVKMLDVFSRNPSDLSSLRNCYVGGEPINRSVAQAFEQVLGKRLWEGYAATEAFPILVTQPRTDADAPAETCGRLVPGAQIRVHDPQGREVPRGVTGEAQFTSPGRMLGYYEEPQMTADRLTADGWVRSGDLVREDEEGYFFVVGRISEMIIRGGANIAPSEVEAAIVDLEGVRDATVVSVADPEYGESVVAFVTTSDPAWNEERLRHELQATLASYKVPSRFLLNVNLPSGSTGKKDRRNASAVAAQILSGA